MSILLGIIVGLVLGLTGAGGSILSVPLLMAGLGWPITQAATVSLLAVSMAASLGTVLAWRHSYVRYRAAMLMALAGIITAPAGIHLADSLPPAMLTAAFALLLSIVAVRMFLQAIDSGQDARIVRAAVAGEGAPAQGSICRVNPATGRLIWRWPVFATLGLIGAVTGFLSGLLGVGGGFLIVPALRATTPLSMHSAVATSLMAISLTSLGTVASGLVQGRTLPLVVALPFVLGALIGMAMGRLAAPHIAGPKLQQAFAVVACIVALVMGIHALALV